MFPRFLSSGHLTIHRKVTYNLVIHPSSSNRCAVAIPHQAMTSSGVKSSDPGASLLTPIPNNDQDSGQLFNKSARFDKSGV